jgi:hypothetical protein
MSCASLSHFHHHHSTYADGPVFETLDPPSISKLKATKRRTSRDEYLASQKNDLTAEKTTLPTGHYQSMLGASYGLEAAMKLFKGCFSLTETPSSFPSSEEWSCRISDENGGFYLFSSTSLDSPPCAFMSLYEQELGKSLHIWIAATLPSATGQGHMTCLFEKAKAIANERGMKEITMNTYPCLFPIMFKTAQSRWGMTLVKTEKSSASFPHDKVFLALTLEGI